jgi:hypothetical protein
MVSTNCCVEVGCVVSCLSWMWQCCPALEYLSQASKTLNNSEDGEEWRLRHLPSVCMFQRYHACQLRCCSLCIYINSIETAGDAAVLCVLMAGSCTALM